MRPRASLAAMSSVGKHTARESEAPNVVRMGKSAWRAPTPEFGPDPARGPGLFPYIESHFSLSARRSGPGPEPTYPSQGRRADLSDCGHHRGGARPPRGPSEPLERPNQPARRAGSTFAGP